MNDLDPEVWLTDVISRIADHPINRINDFLPWNWRLHQQQASVEECHVDAR